MGKRIIQQRRGRGTGPYKSPSHKFKGPSKYHYEEVEAKVSKIIHDAAHTAPMIELTYPNKKKLLTVAAQGVAEGDTISIGENVEVKPGNILPLKNIPEGTYVYNIEMQPGDGGKFVRSSGTFARILAKSDRGVTIKLPSKKEKIFSAACTACVGQVAGGGRLEKPFLKAGTKWHKMKARNKLYPSVSGTSMNSVDHPFGGTSSAHKGKPTVAPKHAPPGRKVGKVRPRRTGKR
ncbi:MAG: 50S ribosomal protein L2 [Nanoarchaeota archaeon]|nr:50S ribosomal protein L2 [Nanoarchaeota archaeon]|tara:strand:+ start:1053 stop:1754 length:702 start_codon:yes stop_codon:yes gene_type:complete